MTSSNGSGASDVEARFAELAAELPREIERLEAQRSEIDAVIKRYRRLIAAVTTTEHTSAAKPPRKRKRYASDEMVRKIAEAITTLDAPFTASELAAHVGVTDPTVRLVVERLREIEFIRAAGKRPDVKGTLPETYALLDPDALSRLGA